MRRLRPARFRTAAPDTATARTWAAAPHHPRLRPAVLAGVVPLAVLLTIVLTVPGAPVMAEPLPFAAGDKVVKPAVAPAAPARVVLDCSVAVDTITVTAALVDTLRGDTSGGASQADGYPCSPWQETGPEHIYRLEVAEETELRATLLDLGGVDLDLFLLDACNTEGCIGHANEELAGRLPAGTYFLIVDGYLGAEGSYGLALEGRHPGVPPEICAPNDFVVVVEETQNQTIEWAGDLAGQPNRIQVDSCSPTIFAGGEEWFAVTLPDSGSLSVNFTEISPTLDVALWLFDDCGTDAACLAFADRHAAGTGETLVWRNLLGRRTTVYLAVDSFRSPQPGAGAYRLGLGLVAAKHRSFSDVRALFR
ncbi:MAG: hypothetical protein R6X25_00965 [Candidatus Krumholzibacteriia bacterium]